MTPREDQIKNLENAVDRVGDPGNQDLKLLLERWSKVNTQVDMRHSKLEKTVKKFQNFQASLKTELAWLGHAEQKIASPEFQIAPEEMESKMSELTVSLSCASLQSI